MSSIYHNPSDAVVQIPDLQYRAGRKTYPLSFSPGEVKDLEVLGFTAAEVKASGQLTGAVKSGLLREGASSNPTTKIKTKDDVGPDGTVSPKDTAKPDVPEDLTKYTKKQLLELAQSRGIDVDEKLPNRELIKLITAAKQADVSPADAPAADS